ncbi:MAG TPA: hypothetical protein VF669_10905 [Tepidisphaeraceae bacterium]
MRAASVAIAMALGIFLFGLYGHSDAAPAPESALARPAPDEVGATSFADVLPPQLVPENRPELWFPSLAESLAGPAATQAPPTSRTIKPSGHVVAPVAPLPPAMFIGSGGAVMVGWATYRIRRRGRI